MATNDPSRVAGTEPDSSNRLKTLSLAKKPFEPDPKAAGGSRRGLWLLAFVVLAVPLGWFGFLRFRPEIEQLQARLLGAAAAAAPKVVEKPAVAPVAPAAVPAEPESLTISGYIVAETKIQVSAKVTGTVEELPIAEGSKVHKGDLLVRIESDQYEADLKQAMASVRIAEARLAELKEGSRKEEIERLRASLEQATARRDFSGQELQRAKLLKGTISVAEEDKVRATHAEAEAYVREIQFALKLLENGTRREQLVAAAAEVERTQAIQAKAQYLFDCTRVRSPIDGTILERMVEQGEALRIDPISGTTALCVVADLTNLAAEVEVQERDLSRVKVGQRCQVYPEIYPDRIFEAFVDRIAPIVNRQRGVVQVTVKIRQPDGVLMPDMSCKVTFLSATAPASSVSRAGEPFQARPNSMQAFVPPKPELSVMAEASGTRSSR